jgi:hypothetical protein
VIPACSQVRFLASVISLIRNDPERLRWRWLYHGFRIFCHRTQLTTTGADVDDLMGYDQMTLDIHRSRSYNDPPVESRILLSTGYSHCHGQNLLFIPIRKRPREAVYKINETSFLVIVFHYLTHTAVKSSLTRHDNYSTPQNHGPNKRDQKSVELCRRRRSVSDGGDRQE